MFAFHLIFMARPEYPRKESSCGFPSHIELEMLPIPETLMRKYFVKLGLTRGSRQIARILRSQIYGIGLASGTAVWTTIFRLILPNLTHLIVNCS
jgi:hypothetical protein